MIKPLILNYPPNKKWKKVLTPLFITRLGGGKGRGGQRTAFD